MEKEFDSAFIEFEIEKRNRDKMNNLNMIFLI